jgi:uncharacterized membrane protein YbhN (UPF0104 family)
MFDSASPELARGSGRSALPWRGQNAARTAAALLIAALLAAGVWFLIGQVASYGKLLQALARAQPAWLVAACAAALASYPCYALLYQALSRVAGGPRPPFRHALRLTAAVFAASVVATAAGRLGTEYWSLRRMCERPSRAWSRVLALNTAEWAILAGLALLGSIALLCGAGRGAPLGVELAWLFALPVCTLPARYLTSQRRRHLREDRGGRFRRTFAAALSGLALLRVPMRRPDRRSGIAGGLIYWAGELLTVWFALRAFGVELGFGALAVGYATGYVSTMLPLPAGGAGSVDAASTFALTLVGVPLGPALLATLVQRLFTYWMPLLVAVLAWRSLRRLSGDLEAVGERRAPEAPTAVLAGAAR